MAKTRTRSVDIDGRFFVPPGVVDIRQENKENGEFAYGSSDTAIGAPVLESPEAIVPMPLDGMQIISQTVRITADGSSVVDVELSFPDVEGVQSIDVRATKI